MGFESVGFEGLVRFVSGAQEGYHLINGIQLVRGDLHVCMEKKGHSEEKVGECQHLRTG